MYSPEVREKLDKLSNDLFDIVGICFWNWSVWRIHDSSSGSFVSRPRNPVSPWPSPSGSNKPEVREKLDKLSNDLFDIVGICFWNWSVWRIHDSSSGSFVSRPRNPVSPWPSPSGSNKPDVDDMDGY